MTIRKISKMLFVINGLQFLLGAGILIAIQSKLLQQSEWVIDFAMILVLLSSLLTIIGLYSATKYQNYSYEESMKNLENLNRKLREQRHDYLNQIQIVYGLLQLEEYQEARSYLQPVFKDMMKINKALKTAQPAVNALLQAKMETAEKQGIDFFLEISTQLKDLAIEPWELCKILANLIDNAVTAVSANTGEKTVQVEIREMKERYTFAVGNNGPKIPDEVQGLIFVQGFTTKKEEGHGMGLAIVSSILKESGGELSMTTVPGETVFSFTLPKKERKPSVISRAKNDRIVRKVYK